MTLQIKELSVKIRVAEDKPAHNTGADTNALLTIHDRALLVDECVEKVLAKLERLNQR